MHCLHASDTRPNSNLSSVIHCTKEPVPSDIDTMCVCATIDVMCVCVCLTTYLRLHFHSMTRRDREHFCYLTDIERKLELSVGLGAMND